MLIKEAKDHCNENLKTQEKYKILEDQKDLLILKLIYSGQKDNRKLYISKLTKLLSIFLILCLVFQPSFLGNVKAGEESLDLDGKYSPQAHVLKHLVLIWYHCLEEFLKPFGCEA